MSRRIHLSTAREPPVPGPLARLIGPARRAAVVAAVAWGCAAVAPLGPASGTQLLAQETHLLVISGLSGDPRFESEFLDWGTRMVEAAQNAGVRPENITFLAEDPSLAPGIDGESRREDVEAAIGSIDQRAAPEDRVMVLLIGHGSGSGENSRVSLPGPSLRASEYDELLDRLAPRTVALVNVASASGDFVPVLAAEGRVLVTATRSARQRNAAIFGGFFVEAFAGEGADLDRDGRVSVLEAFEYARQETARYYGDRGLIASEQPLIEDRTTGSGSDAPTQDDDVGLLASRFFLESAVPGDIAGDAEGSARLRELYARQDQLDQDIARLGQRETELEPEAYEAALQELLVELARVSSEIREIEDEP